MKTPAHEFWLNPNKQNHPLTYLMHGDGRAIYLRRMIEGWFPEPVHWKCQHTVLEVGCNAGRNLIQLASHGYLISGVEINPDAVELMHALYPTESWSIKTGPASETLPRCGVVDIVFTIAVLEHIHPDEIDVTLDEMTRLAGSGIITIEEEEKTYDRHWPRNYQGLFECRGFRQVHEETVPAEVSKDLRGFRTRVFRRETNNSL